MFGNLQDSICEPFNAYVTFDNGETRNYRRCNIFRYVSDKMIMIGTIGQGGYAINLDKIIEIEFIPVHEKGDQQDE